MSQRYLIALGSNRRHVRHGGPRKVIEAALATMEADGIAVLACSRIIDSRPLGPSLRTYANAVALVNCTLGPPDLLERLHAIEAAFGRCRRGQPWRERVLDLDIALWEGGCWADAGLVVPHRALRDRRFVLGPAAEVAGTWRDPLTGRTLRQLAARLG